MSTNAKGEWLGEIQLSRGFAIVAVLLIHVTGLPLRALDAGSPAHLFYVAVNRGMQFAVPLFIMVSALVLAHRYGDPGRAVDWRQFYRSRWRQVVVPYLAWTAVALAFRFVVLGDPVPTSPMPWIFWLVCGKAYFHLYFLSVIIQFYLLFPVLRRVWRAFQPGFAAAVVLFGAGQAAFYWINRLCIYDCFPYPGSIVFSYLFPIGVGFWLGRNVSQWSSWWRVWRWIIIPAAAAAGAVYVDRSVALLTGPVNTFAFQMTWQVYVTALGLAVIFLSRRLLSRKPEPGFGLRSLSRIGRDSFGIYLMHPFFLLFWQRLIAPETPALLHLSVPGSLVFILGASLAGVELLRRLSLGVLIGAGAGRGGSRAPTAHRSLE